jgi:hypothetical protein
LRAEMQCRALRHPPILFESGSLWTQRLASWR